MEVNAADTALAMGAYAQNRLFPGAFYKPYGNLHPCAGGPFESSWAFETPAPDDVLAAFQQQSDAVTSSHVLRLSTKPAFWVVAYRARETEYRVVLPLVGAAVSGCLRSADVEEVLLCFISGDTAPEFQAPLRLSSLTKQTLIEAHVAEHPERELVADLLSVSLRLLETDALQRPTVRQPTRVIVSPVLADDFLADEAAQGALGMTLHGLSRL